MVKFIKVKLKLLAGCVVATILCAILFYFEVGSPNPAGVDGKAVWAGLGILGAIAIIGNIFIPNPPESVNWKSVNWQSVHCPCCSHTWELGKDEGIPTAKEGSWLKCIWCNYVFTSNHENTRRH